MICEGNMRILLLKPPKLFLPVIRKIFGIKKEEQPS